MRQRVLFLYVFPETVETCTASSVLASTHAVQPVKERIELRQEPTVEGEHEFVVGEGSARSMSPHALLAQISGEET
jgi:hypothetical protein